ncbi:putative F-box protein At5g40050 isoform X1 [Durio zibethinus]|uniref:F-box protein At5g40050 isoform X1 n=1 Tax=Durio zibethinus TaxID=66656 RepID=A0A6P5WGP7_DURZI|nr:putative F-box protein At5g40050 isoform X1 [Durio zibethinus]
MKEREKYITVNERIEFADQMSREPGVKTKRKREDLNIINGSSKSRRKGISKETKIMEQKVDRVDYISQLPEHIIHHIISFLRCKKDAARTSILSKRWRDMWVSFSNLVFDQRKFHGQVRRLETLSEEQIQKIKNVEMFRNYVDNTLQRHVELKDRSIQKFVLHMTHYNSELTTCMDKWIDLALKYNIKELELHVPGYLHGCYRLPQCVFAANTITALRVYGCKLRPCNNLKLSNLQKVCLGKLYVNEWMIENLIRSCPLLEDFRLIYPIGLKTFKVPNLPKLKRVDLHTCSGLREVNLQASNLETFWYLGKKYLPCKIELSTCNTLKNLTLEDAKLKDELFQKHLSCFLVLEKLVLSKCNALENIIISSFKLKTLILRECKQLEEADIDTPNLLSFEYKGDKMPFSSLNPTSLKEAKLYFKPSRPEVNTRFHKGDDHTPWFAKLQAFLERFDYSRGLKLMARSNKNIVVYEKPKGIFLPRVYDLKLDVVKSSVALEDLLDDILRTWHPETLSSLSISRSNLPKLVRKRLIGREKEPSCCTYNIPGTKCWRHFLEYVKTENLVNNKDTSEWIAWLRSSRSMFKINCFKLTWKSRKHVSQE